MKTMYRFWILLFGMIASVSVFGQAGVDTLGLTGTMADTVVAGRLLGEMKGLILEKKWEDAEKKGEVAKGIYERTLGNESKQVADLWHQLGRIKAYTGNYDDAIRCNENALAIRLKVFGFDHPDLISSYFNLGILFHVKGSFDKAIDYKKKALDIRIKTLGPEHLDVAASYSNLGDSFDSNGDYNKAIDSYQKALDIRLKTLGPEHLDVAASYNNLGISLESKGDFAKAIDCKKKALDIRLKALGPEHLDVAASYNNLGVSFESKGEYNISIQYHQEALNIRLKILGRTNSKVAQSYRNIADVYRTIRQYKKAETNYLKVLKINQNQFGKNYNDNNFIYAGLGDIYNLMGNYERSIEYYLLGLNILEINGNQESDDYAIICNNLSSVYTVIGQYDKAKNLLKKSHSIFEKTVEKDQPSLAFSYVTLGNVFNKEGEYEKAIEYYGKAMAVSTKVLGNSHRHLGTIYNNIGQLYISMGQYEKAKEFFKRSLYIFKDIFGEKNPTTAVVYQGLAKSFQLSGDFEEAVKKYQDALNSCCYTLNEDFSNVNDLNELIKTLQLYTSCKYEQYNSLHNVSSLMEANNLSQIAINAINYLSKTKSIENSNILTNEVYFPVFETAIKNTLLSISDLRIDSLKTMPFTYSEKSKASLLQAQIKETSAFSGLPDSLLQQEHELRIDITWREKQRQALLDKGVAETDTNTLRISSIIFDLRRQYEALKDTLETRYPDYYRLKYDLSTVSLDYVQDTLLQPGQTLLEYFTGDSAVYIFVLRHDTFHVVEVKKDFPLEDWVKHLRHGLTDYHVKNSKSAVYLDSTAREYVAAASDLYQKLIAPVAGLLDSTVVIVPDGVLGYVPFDVLLSERPTIPTRFHSHAYLGKEKRISYAYSATLLREMRDKRHKKQPTENVLALAPFFRGDVKQLHEQVDTLSDILALRRDTLAALPASGREALVVAKIYDGKALLGDASPKEILQQEAGRYRILHLSTHGKADDKVGDYAYLGFAMPGDALAFDKFYAKDIYNLALNADLVTLSACETGIGELKRGEGIISLARAFAYAGAKSIVTTLWSVNDTRTGELMEDFYKNLYKGMDKDVALWQAKKDFIAAHKKDAAHPYFWSGFIPVGDMRKIDRN